MRKFILVKYINLSLIFTLTSLSFSVAQANDIKTCQTYLGYPSVVVQTLSQARAVMDKAKAMHFISSSKYDHLIDDLSELTLGLDKKSKHETFLGIIQNWSVFALKLESQITAYEKLSLEDQKKYFEKMKLPISFMTSHFITFLETKHLKFNYKRMNSILIYMNKISSEEDLILYLYEFEKQVLKFFSVNEFINCKA